MSRPHLSLSISFSFPFSLTGTASEHLLKEIFRCFTILCEEHDSRVQIGASLAVLIEVLPAVCDQAKVLLIEVSVEGGEGDGGGESVGFGSFLTHFFLFLFLFLLFFFCFVFLSVVAHYFDKLWGYTKESVRKPSINSHSCSSFGVKSNGFFLFFLFPLFYFFFLSHPPPPPPPTDRPRCCRWVSLSSFHFRRKERGPVGRRSERK